MLMWQRVNEERDACGNIICYCNITHSNAKCVYNQINKVLHDTKLMLLSIINVVTYICYYSKLLPTMTSLRSLGLG